MLTWHVLLLLLLLLLPEALRTLLELRVVGMLLQGMRGHSVVHAVVLRVGVGPRHGDVGGLHSLGGLSLGMHAAGGRGDLGGGSCLVGAEPRPGEGGWGNVDIKRLYHTTCNGEG